MMDDLGGIDDRGVLIVTDQFDSVEVKLEVAMVFVDCRS